jgi:4-hydroxybenzoate polyprenyltransferase
MKLSDALHLIRFHKPVGTLLLWFPTGWALWLANKGTPPRSLLIYFFLGTFLMRSAGCILNDIADRHIDLHVKRTEKRPLTAGNISLLEALVLLVLMLVAAFVVLIQLPTVCFYYALLALGVTILYPFCKRFFDAPQLVLGVAFSMGIPMAYAASYVPPDRTMAGLLLLNFCWIITYDTLYAMVDKADDLRIHVKSTAILFGAHWRSILLLLQGITHALWLWIAWTQSLAPTFYLFWGACFFLFIYQQHLIQKATDTAYLRAFSTHALYGLILWVGLIVSQ